MNADPRRRRHPHDAVELLARKICDGANGEGHFAAKGTHRNHWRKRATRLMAAQAEDNIPPLIRYLMQSMGWIA